MHGQLSVNEQVRPRISTASLYSSALDFRCLGGVVGALTVPDGLLPLFSLEEDSRDKEEVDVDPLRRLSLVSNARPAGEANSCNMSMSGSDSGVWSSTYMLFVYPYNIVSRSVGVHGVRAASTRSSRLPGGASSIVPLPENFFTHSRLNARFTSRHVFVISSNLPCPFGVHPYIPLTSFWYLTFYESWPRISV